ncbi:hypothetical protein [Saccharothrix obliqua]|uniref:hypothetical protein n=1 Tax=Saccharothrix obliqua TaxID=2861747 RepID=UPI0021508148|nr:hypothetical protein [Saccharothrix obliqua]
MAHAAAVATIAAGLLTAVLTGTASACSCFPNDNEGWRYARADHVFVAKVLSERVEGSQYVYRAQVGTEYKGDVPHRVEIATHVQGSACGVRLTTGTEYLVFGHGDSSDRRVETAMCSGTRLASGGPPTTTPTGSTTITTTPTTTCATSPAAA